MNTCLQRHSRLQNRGRQRGASLIIIVLMVLAMALTTLTAFHLSSNQYRLVANLQHIEQAFNRAEGALALGEEWLGKGDHARAAGFSSFDSASPALHPVGHLALVGLDPKTMSWSDANSVADADGRYLIELLARNRQSIGSGLQIQQRQVGSCSSVDLFRIHATSNSVRGASRTVSSIYATDGCAAAGS